MKPVGEFGNVRDLYIQERGRLRVRDLTLSFFAYSENMDSRRASFYHFSLENLALLSLVKEVTPSPDRKLIKLLTFDNLFPPLRHFR